MARIALCMLPEPGHILPTVRVAKFLQAGGHVVTYITVPRYESFFRSHQLPFYSIFSDMFPTNQADDLFGSIGDNPSQLLAAYHNSAVGNEFAEKLILSLRNLRFECLLCDTIIVRIFGNTLRNAFSQAIVAVSIGLPDQPSAYKFGIPELVLCPWEMEIPHAVDPAHSGFEHAFYAEPSVFNQRREVEFPWNNIGPDRHIVYCSLGTQYVRYRQAPEIINSIIHAFSALPDYKLVLVTGSLLNRYSWESLPNNVVMVRTAPQLELLRRSKLFITHGGQGGIKEAVMSGVPMLVIPFDMDQPRNAARVFYHRLGRYCLPSQCTPERIQQLVETMLENDEMRDSLTYMRRIFCDREAQAPSVQFIEQLLAGWSHSKS
jgi:UDP:flavonoid glycosyltransferase YjiC (YdhE family)